MNKKVLAFAALAEAGTGVIVLACPPIVVRLLFAAEISGAGVLMSRFAGIAWSAWVCPAGRGPLPSNRLTEC